MAKRSSAEGRIMQQDINEAKDRDEWGPPLLLFTILPKIQLLIDTKNKKLVGLTLLANRCITRTLKNPFSVGRPSHKLHAHWIVDYGNVYFCHLVFLFCIPPFVLFYFLSVHSFISTLEEFIAGKLILARHLSFLS